MALVETTLKTSLKASFIDLFTLAMGDVTLRTEQTDRINQLADSWAEKITTDITDYIKTANVTFPIGAINVVGSPSAQSNIVPCTGGTLS